MRLIFNFLSRITTAVRLNDGLNFDRRIVQKFFSFESIMNSSHLIVCLINLDHWIAKNFFRLPVNYIVHHEIVPLDRAIAFVDRAIDPPCIEGYKIYFLGYFGLIFALIYCLKN